MKIVSLVDNLKKREKMPTEHGLSFYIETKKHKILFDLGASDLFLTNAEKLGVDIKQVDTVVISHGHDDHGGGINTFLKVNDIAKIYISSYAFGEFYSEKDGNHSYIGLDKSLRNNDRINLVYGNLKIDEELFIFSGVKEINKRFSANLNLKKKVEDKFIVDDFLHEQNLIITQESGEVLFAGCSHNGIDNIVGEFYRLKGRFPKAVFGGFHLSRFLSEDDKINSLERVKNTVLKSGSVFYTCHCTGEENYLELKTALNAQIEYFYCGEKILI